MTTPPASLNITLRRALVSDAGMLCHSEQAATATTGFLLLQPEELTPTAYERQITRLETDGLYLVAEVDGRPAGHLRLEALPSKGLAHISHLSIVVHSGQVSDNVGRRLMQGALQWAEQHSQLGKIEALVRATDKPALALYRAMGFVEEGRLSRRTKLEDGTYADDVALAWFPRESNFP